MCIRGSVCCVDDVQEVLGDILQAGDILVTQGAGSVGRLVKILADARLI